MREQRPEYAGLIDKWEKQGVTATLDYLLKAGGHPILWVDVKDQQHIRNPFNLNADQNHNYLLVSTDTDIPASIVVFQMGDDTPRMWGYVLPMHYNHIPLSDIFIFESELRHLAKLGV